MTSKSTQRLWRTPISKVKVLDFVSCGMSSVLEVTVLELRQSQPVGQDVISYRFTWRGMDVMGFCVMNEEPMEPWIDHSSPEKETSWTYEIVGITLKPAHPDLRNFVIRTRDYEIHILSDKEPVFSVV